MGGRAGGGAGASAGGGSSSWAGLTTQPFAGAPKAGELKAGDKLVMQNGKQVEVVKVGKSTKKTVDIETKLEGSRYSHWATWGKDRYVNAKRV